jgi:hypothetical protein
MSGAALRSLGAVLAFEDAVHHSKRKVGESRMGISDLEARRRAHESEIDQIKEFFKASDTPAPQSTRSADAQMIMNRAEFETLSHEERSHRIRGGLKLTD